VRQFFMRDYGEEASLLDALSRHLAAFRVMITYNGRAFDQPLLETRYRLNRARAPFEKFVHLDLLHGARQLWKLRFDSCRLVELEQQVLGVERQGDLPGALIPYVYFEYLRTGEMARLLPVFHHNAIDILTLACLTGIVPYAFKDPEGKDPAGAPLRNGAEMAGVARWLRNAGEIEQARTLFRRAIDAGLPDEILFQTLWHVAALERKLGCDEAALGIWSDLAAAKNPFRSRALEELAKHYEHRQKQYALALGAAQAAIAIDDSAALRKREQRLLRKISGATAATRA
jgi:tetratricopeptide (TPR) repeat protein